VADHARRRHARPAGRGGAGPSGQHGDAYTAALILLGRRELSEAQVRARLARRGFAETPIDEAVSRLKAARALDDQRVARAAARLESAVRLRGRRRTLQKVRALGISEEDARAAVDAVFQEVDEDALLERALARRLRGTSAADLDRAGVRRVAAALIRQGFSTDAVLARLRRKGAPDSTRD
jgi:regulatory protein